MCEGVSGCVRVCEGVEHVTCGESNTLTSTVASTTFDLVSSGNHLHPLSTF